MTKLRPSQNPLKFAGWSALLAIGLLAGSCTDDGDAGMSGTDASLRAKALSSEGTDVVGFRFDVYRCATEIAPAELALSEFQALQEQRLPGGIGSLQNRPLDEESEHQFADFFKVLPAGCYDVHVQPVMEDGRNSTQCAAAFKKDIWLGAGATQEIFLLSQCAGSDPEFIDVVAALNHPPEILSLGLDDSRFQCGQPGQVCVLAYDRDEDPLEYELLLNESCLASERYAGTGGAECWNVTCGVAGRADMRIQVYDLIWRPHEGGPVKVRVEDWLREEGYEALTSNVSIDFWAHYPGVRYYPDVDGDLFGDKYATPSYVCTEADLLPNTSPNADDCNDIDGAIHPGAEEVCDNGIDDNCDGQRDEGCGQGSDTGGETSTGETDSSGETDTTSGDTDSGDETDSGDTTSTTSGDETGGETDGSGSTTGGDDGSEDDGDDTDDDETGDADECEGAGYTCGSFVAGECTHCGPNGVCVKSTDGTSYCHRSMSCVGLTACTSNEDCSARSKCILDTCCGHPVCIPRANLGDGETLWCAGAFAEEDESGAYASGLKTIGL